MSFEHLDPMVLDLPMNFAITETNQFFFLKPIRDGFLFLEIKSIINYTIVK